MRNVNVVLPLNGSGPLQVLDDVSLRVTAREFVAVVGPSGCGKSTLLNVLSGVGRASSGSVRVRGSMLSDCCGVMSYMPQECALMPWRSVIDNAILGLEIDGMARRDAREMARELMPLFGLEGFEDAHVWQLSGGMKQRVALMRTLLRRKDIVLLDEPFGALDALTRHVMQDWLLEVWERFESIFLLVTHDIEEAIFLADRVIVLSARPAHVLADLAVPLRRPRQHALESDPRLLDIKAEITGLLHAESLVALRQQHDHLGDAS